MKYFPKSGLFRAEHVPVSGVQSVVNILQHLLIRYQTLDPPLPVHYTGLILQAYMDIHLAKL